MKTQTIEAIQNNIVFKFTEDVTQTRFVNKAASGILVTSGDGNQMTQPRWGKVLFVGPEVNEVNVGDFILIEAGKWTFSFYINEERYWKTDEDKVIAVSDEPGETY